MIQELLNQYPDCYIQLIKILEYIFPENPESVITTHFRLPENYGKIKKSLLQLFIDNPLGKMFWGYKIYWGKTGEKWNEHQRQLSIGETELEQYNTLLDVTDAFLEVDEKDSIVSIFGRQSRNPKDTLNSVIQVYGLYILYDPIQSSKPKVIE